MKKNKSNTPTFQDLRLNVCNSCEFKVESFCGLCGCDVASLTAGAGEKCPANPPRWIGLVAQSKVGGNNVQSGQAEVQDPTETLRVSSPVSKCSSCGHK